MKFSQMPYQRPEFEPLKQQALAHIAAFEQAASGEDALAAYTAFDALKIHFITQGYLAYIRYTLDTNDAFYIAEQNYFDETEPMLLDLLQAMEKALLASPHRAFLEDKFGKLMFENAEIHMKAFSPAIIPDLQQDNKLASEYKKLLASAQIAFDGKTLTLAELEPYHQHADRAVRQASIKARAAWFLSHTERLDSLFGELVSARNAMGRKMGYADYVELGYYRMGRNGYDEDMVAAFREGVRRHIVPIAARLKREQAARIGVSALTMHDDAFEFPTGNAKPTGTPEDIFAHGKAMYHELSADTAEFIDFMLQNELFDVLTKPGKSGGGYCAYLEEYQSPFIFANFNGTSGDIDVLTHEAGHAFADYINREVFPSELSEFTYETAEVHSMSMEFFTWPWMEGFFGPTTGKYRYSHLAGALTFIPYGVMVDDFQHRVYKNPGMSAAERNALWLELEGIYRPWLDLKDTPFYGEGRRWQAQSHIYERPFYYIDYCLAQTIALAFWAEDQTDHAAAWKRYRTFVGYGGAKTFIDSVASAGLPNPFQPDALKGLAEAATAWLDAQPSYT